MIKKEIKLRIKSIQRSGVDDDGDDIIEIVTDAVLSESNGKFLLEYDELLSDGASPTSTSLTFEKNTPGTVFLSREGDVTMTCVIAERTRYRFSYNLGFASIELVCVGHKVENSISPFGGKIFLSYDIEARGVPVQRCELMITII